MMSVEAAIVKRCKRCGEWRPADFEHFSPSRRIYLNPYCRPCNRLRTKEWRTANPDRVHRYAVQYGRQYYAANAESIKAATRRYYNANRGACVEAARVRRDAYSKPPCGCGCGQTVPIGRVRYATPACLDKMQRHLSGLSWRRRYADVLARNREWAQRNPAKMAKRAAEWKRRNPDKYEANRRRADRARYQKEALAEERRILPRDVRRAQHRSRGECVYCHDAAGAEVDHVAPLVLGGRNAIGNLAFRICRPCNATKSGDWLVQWRYGKGAKRLTYPLHGCSPKGWLP